MVTIEMICLKQHWHVSNAKQLMAYFIPGSDPLFVMGRKAGNTEGNAFMVFSINILALPTLLSLLSILAVDRLINLSLHAYPKIFIGQATPLTCLG